MKGLLTGAGFSMGLGMPSVWVFTDLLRTHFPGNKLKQYNENWKSNGNGYDDNFFDEFLEVYNNRDYHYEQILGWLQSNGKVNSQHYSMFIKLVYYLNLIIVKIHFDKKEFIQKGLSYYRGLKHLVPKNEPLWIFTLNHDIITEILCNEFEIPLKTGFPDKIKKISLDEYKEGEINLRINENKLFDLKELDFFPPDKSGINLVKLHGAVDIFTLYDSTLIGKIDTNLYDFSDYIDNLYKLYFKIRIKINEQWGNITDFGINSINEIMYSDDENIIQFLRNTMVSGEKKFDKHYPQVLPFHFLNYFSKVLTHIEELTVIGYSFGDSHINLELKKWLTTSKTNKMIITSPNAEIPFDLDDFKDQISIHKNKTIEYLIHASFQKLTSEELYQLKMRRAIMKKDFSSLEIITNERLTEDLNILIQRLDKKQIIEEFGSIANFQTFIERLDEFVKIENKNLLAMLKYQMEKSQTKSQS